MTTAGSDTVLEVEFPPKPEYVGVARHVAAALARMEGMADDVVDDVRLAVSEACTNAATMTGRVDPGAAVAFRASVGADGFRVEVLDRGPGPRDDAEASDPDSEVDSLEFSFESDLSLPLLRGLVDDLQVIRRDGGGSIVRFGLPLSSTALD
jgi:anti-sigma regulatory factor (Ser/Thr protein kinase)